MLDATDLARALTVPCPLTACMAFCGEDCISYVTGRPTAPHRQRLLAAGVVRPRPVLDDPTEESA